MEIGDLVMYRDRLYILCGLDPMGVDDRRAQIEDPHTGERQWVSLSEVEKEPPPTS